MINKIIYLILIIIFIEIGCKPDFTIAQENQMNDTAVTIKAIELFYEGMYKESLRKIEYSLSMKPNEPELYFWKAKNYVAMNNTSEAVKHYSIAIKKSENIAKYYNNRGLCYLSLESYELAEKDFRSAILINDSSDIFYNNLGLLYSEQGEEYKAISVYTKAISVSKSPYLILYNRAISFINVKEYYSCIRDLNLVIQHDSKNPAAYFYRGISKYKVGNEDKGCEDIFTAERLGFELDTSYINVCQSLKD
jgi:tetratricopeptide (TPR) repeat protein